MSRIILHCHSGSVTRQSVIEDAHSLGLQTHVHFDHNQHSVEVSGGDSKAFETFIKKYQNQEEFVIFHDSSDPRARKGAYKPHMKQMSSGSEIKTRSIPGAGINGNTAVALANYYNFPAQKTGSKPVIAIISLDGGIQTSDLQNYWKNVQGLTVMPTVVHVLVEGAPDTFTGSDSDVENALDVEISGSMCPNSTILFYSAPNTDIGFYQAINSAIAGSMVNGHLVVPNVISISWGMAESGYTKSMANSFNTLFALANSKRINTCVASGDSGSTDGVSGGQPHVDFPASSPYVVSCGGTSLSGPTETAWSWSSTYQWGTGGGISSYFKAPTYQIPVVSYPANTKPSTASLKGNRCVPDLALNADPVSGWTIYFNNQLLVNGVGGTSCVAPAIAGLIASMGLSYPVNFNTSLYSVYQNATQKPLCFKDITSGNNDSISGGSGVWNCGAGFDFVTGVGSINGKNLLAALTSITPHEVLKPVVSIVKSVTEFKNGDFSELPIAISGVPRGLTNPIKRGVPSAVLIKAQQFRPSKDSCPVPSALIGSGVTKTEMKQSGISRPPQDLKMPRKNQLKVVSLDRKSRRAYT